MILPYLDTYPFLWCLVHRDEIQVKPDDRGQAVARDISQLKLDLERFMNEGKGDKKKASLYHNVINLMLIDINII